MPLLRITSAQLSAVKVARVLDLLLRDADSTVESLLDATSCGAVILTLRLHPALVKRSDSFVLAGGIEPSGAVLSEKGPSIAGAELSLARPKTSADRRDEVR